MNPFPTKNRVEGPRPKFGTSYSFEQAAWFGIDPRQGFVKLISDFKFDWVRLPFFWNQMVDEAGNLKVDDLKFAIAQAKKKDIKVVIALGAKVPYYPEYHLPKSMADKLKFGDVITRDHPVAADILEIDRKVVSELSTFDNVFYWQIENEPYLGNVNGWKIDKSLLEAEIEVIRAADPKKRLIILTTTGSSVFDNNWKDTISLLSAGDVFGVNAYFKTQGIHLFSFSLIGKQIEVPWPRFLVWPVQSWYFLSPNFEKMAKYAADKDVEFWVMEAQAEPYFRTLEDASGSQLSYSNNDIGKAVDFLKGSGVGNIGLWGANFWQFREKQGDSSWQDAVGSIVN